MTPSPLIKYQDLIERQEGTLARWQVAARELQRAADGSGLVAADVEVTRQDVGAVRVLPELKAIDGLVNRGQWQPLYRGVYWTYSGRPSLASLHWAAVLRCGPEAALSHFTAAEIDGFMKAQDRATHVTIPERGRTRFSAGEFTSGTPRIVLHRSSRLASARHPAKTPPRTRVQETVLDMTDLAHDFDAAFAWMSAACGKGLVTTDQLRDAALARARLRWRSDVLAALEDIADGIMSALERRYVRDVERPHGLPKPVRQARMKRGGSSAYLDNLYAEFGLAVELDGLVAHPPESRWRDVHRDNYFAAAGIITLRYNWVDITQRPCRVASEVASTLRRAGWTGDLRRCGPTCSAKSS